MKRARDRKRAREREKEIEREKERKREEEMCDLDCEGREELGC